MKKPCQCIRCKKKGFRGDTEDPSELYHKGCKVFKHIGAGEYLCRDCWWTCKVKYG